MIEERFWQKVEKTEGCWLWTAYAYRGYGRFVIGGKVRQAHRVAYECATGPIPDGYQIDHLCRNPSCVNPSHLEAVPRLVNVQRGLKGVLHTVCSKGHLLEEGGMYARPNISAGSVRNCLRCRREYHREYMRNLRESRSSVEVSLSR